MSVTFDRRLTPVRPDLAGSAYKGKVSAERFVEGTLKTVTADVLDLRPEPDLGKLVDTQVLYGETFRVFDETPEGWSWGQLETDGYVGWISSTGLGPHRLPTHRVRALRTYRYPVADLKYPPLGLISLGSLVTVVGETTTRGLGYALLGDGSAVVARHLVPLDAEEEDWVAVAEEMIGTPYLWAGRTSLGIDCSALVQIAAQTAGLSVPRDSDMQEKGTGDSVTDWQPDSLKRGDLMFWRGHVGIIRGENSLLHANGHTMTVAIEPLDEAIDRIAKTEWGAVMAVRRL
jgi:cell wall-associated NlpC family hydrolase